MPIDLEQHLKKLCDEHDPKLNLYERLLRVRISAEIIWKEQRLKWFTDHKAETHSRYIVQHLGSILAHLQGTNQKLNPHELYILLVSCYLHDIGMQDFNNDNGRGVNQFTEEDYERIRIYHPVRSKELIIRRTLQWGRDEFHIDLDDDAQYLVPIALVSQGHGSNYFIDTVEELHKLPHRPGNMPLRGGLLTALLFIGDELDLHEQRAKFPQEFSLSPVSLLHHHIHHYVTALEILDGRTPKHRRIRLTLQFPQDSDEYRVDVRTWITAKLQKQLKLATSIIEQYTQSELLWDDQIEVIETIDHYGVRRSLQSPKNIIALNELKHDIISSQTVNREELINALKNAIKKDMEHFQAIQIFDREDSDWSYIVKQLIDICRRHNVTFLHVGFHLSAGHGPTDVLYHISCELEKAGWSCSTYNAEKELVTETQPDSLDTLSKALLTDIFNYTSNHCLVLLLERIDKAESEVVRWVVKWLLPELSSNEIKSLVIYTQFEIGGIETTVDVDVFHLAPFTTEQIKEHLQAGFGYPSDQAEKEAIYLFSSSSGMPGSVHRGLATKRIQGVKIL